jgi:hypothetical protein
MIEVPASYEFEGEVPPEYLYGVHLELAGKEDTTIRPMGLSAKELKALMEGRPRLKNPIAKTKKRARKRASD